MTDDCTKLPQPDRCATCPALAWPHGGASAEAMRDWAASVRCPHDHPGGPVPVWGDEDEPR